MNNREFGNKGEDLACEYLINIGTQQAFFKTLWNWYNCKVEG